MKDPYILASGAYADVWDMNDGTVIKAFKSKQRAHGNLVDIRDHDLLTKMFHAKEIESYEILITNKNINKFIPKYYGLVNPCEKLPKGSNQYVEGAGILLEKIEGKDRKVAYLEDLKLVVDEILTEMTYHLNGVCVWDASCFYESETNFKIIDFSIWDGASDYECYLCDNGVFTNQQKEELSSMAKQLTTRSTTDAQKAARPLA